MVRTLSLPPSADEIKELLKTEIQTLAVCVQRLQRGTNIAGYHGIDDVVLALDATLEIVKTLTGIDPLTNGDL
jgi:hypothetical protein